MLFYLVNFGFGSDDEEPQFDKEPEQELPKRNQIKKPNLTLDI